MSSVLRDFLFDPTAIGFVVRLLLGVTAVWLAAAGAALALRRSSAALRHRVWSMSVLAALALPALLVTLPEWRVGTIQLAAPAAPPAQNAVEKPTTPVEPEVVAALARPAPQRPRPQGNSYSAPKAGITPAGAPVDSARTAEAGSAMATEPAAPTSTSAPAVAPQEAWHQWIFLAWLLPALWLVLRLARAEAAARRLVRRATEVDDPAATSTMQRLRDRLGLRARPRLLQSGRLASPVCLGWLRPCVVLPDDWRQWPAGKMEAVLTHELAHVARRDVPWQALARTACAAYWFHPLAWVAAWRMRVERELACDDWVLRAGETSTRYARWLVDVAALLSRRCHPAEAAGVAMAARGGFEKRITALLDPRRRRVPLSRRAAALTAGVAVAFLVAIGTLSPVAPRSTAVAAGTETRPAKAETMRVSGTVTTEEGQPAADVLVQADHRGIPYSTRTSADGRFALEIKSNNFTDGILRAATPGSARLAFVSFDGRVTDEQARAVRLVLRRAREFAVAVNDSQGRPVAGAWVMANASYTPVAEATTDAAGKVVLRMPADAPPMYVLAFKPEAGFDYVLFWRKDAPRTDPYRLDPDYAGPLSFTLNGSKKVTVRVTDDQQRPMAGVEVYPWVYEKPRKGHHVNLSGVPEFKKTTDDRGVAAFLVPVDQTAVVTFWPTREGYFARKRSLWDPKSGGTEVEARLERQAKVAGRVVDAGGRPVGGATVRVNGEGPDDAGFHGDVLTREDGRFEIEIYADMYYLFVADKDRLASPPHVQMIRKGAEVKPIELTLAPGTRVYGRVTAGPERTAMPGAHVALARRDTQSYYRLPEGQHFPGNLNGGKAILPSVSRHVTADESGAFEFYTGPGEHQLSSFVPGSSAWVAFTLLGDGQYSLRHYKNGETTEEKRSFAPEQGVELNLHGEERKGAPKVIKGRVVLRDKPEVPVAEAKLSGVPKGDESYHAQGTSDAQGNFTVRRAKSDAYLHATTADRALSGIVLVKAHEYTATVPVAPTASARGRLVDQGGNPAAGRSIDYGVQIVTPGKLYSYRFGGRVKVAADGTFVLEGLMPGYEYILHADHQRDAQGRLGGWHTNGRVKAERPERVEMGDVKLLPDPPEYRPKTPQERATESFAKKDPVEQRLAQARHVAKVLHQNVLVVLAAPDSPAGKEFHELWYDSDNYDVWNALAEYVPVVLNVQAPETGARAWAGRAKVTWPADGKGMTLAALDLEGRLVGQASGEALMEGGKISRARIIDFAKKHAPALPDARKVLDEALAKAGREGKHVLVEESSPYCGWCVKLADYLEAQKELIGKDFITVSLQRRFPNGKEVLDPLGKRDGGVPWMAVLSPDGKPVITSDGPNGNIGYPVKAEERAHWEKMLRAARRRLTDVEIEALLRPLRADDGGAEPPGAGGAKP